MADEDQEDLGGYKQEDTTMPPGGRSSRGPQTTNPAGRFEPDALVPPYEGRSQETRTGAAVEADHKAFRADEYAPPPGEGREISDEERRGYDSAEIEPKDTHGVGASITESGEELAARDPNEWAETGTHGESDRAYGKPKQPEKSDSVGAQKNIDPDSPVMPFGDQGG